MTTKKTARFFGCHVSASGGLEKALLSAKELNVNTIQIHPSPPQRWLYQPFAAGLEEKFLAGRKESGVEKVFFHGIYLINLANPDPGQSKLSTASLVHYLDLLQRMQGDGVIFHVGSNKDQPSERSGFEQAAANINRALEQSKHDSKLLLEVAAGSGSIIGDRLEELAEIYELVEQKKRVGFALDSQHLWASGYDIAEHLAEFVAEVRKVLTWEKVWAIHLNDSKTELASRKDRHENIGDGLIGWEALARFFCHPELAGIPFILETPNMKDVETAKLDVAKLRKMLNGTGAS